MKKFKCSILFLSIAALFLFGAIPVNAEENAQVVDGGKIIDENNLTTSTESTYKELSKEFQLRDATPEELKSDLKGIKFDSEEELATFLENASKAPITKQEVIIPKSGFSTLATGNVKRKKGIEHIGIWGQVNIEADFGLSGSGSFYQINSVNNIETYASGFVFPFDWEQTGRPYGRISENKQSATAYGGGNVQYLLFFNGIGKVYERHVDCEVTFKTGR
ncbi:hypothetical protein ABES25_18445 [Bacillus gobiensis]|uniref:hypothetical protein n=1 Tax=Bacillus gobiensis TaxID=1441095 RepID=UPI003D241D14